MLRDVIEKELKDCVYAHRSVLVFILSTVLFGISIYTGSREYQAGLQEFRLAQAAHRRQIAGPANL